ncbi:MAG: hypothetical protein CMH55_09830 [Myxococcales bacterium]|nr:hypothetical protein [Myxococcales bacterium]
MLGLINLGCIPVDGETSQFHADMQRARLHDCNSNQLSCEEIANPNYCSPVLVSGAFISDETGGDGHYESQHQCLLHCEDGRRCPQGYRCVDRNHDGDRALCLRDTLCRGNAHCIDTFHGLGVLDSHCAEAPAPVCRVRLGQECDRDSDCSDLHPQASCYMNRCEFEDAQYGDGQGCEPDFLYSGRCKPKASEPTLEAIWEQIGSEGHGMNPCDESNQQCSVSGGGQGVCANLYGDGHRCHPLAMSRSGCPGGFYPFAVEGAQLGVYLCIPKIPCRTMPSAVTGEKHLELNCDLTGTTCVGESRVCIDQEVLSCSTDGDCNDPFTCYLGVCAAPDGSGACANSSDAERAHIETCALPDQGM